MNGDLNGVQCKSKARAMAGFYGMQFEALMKEVCVDFGRKLIKSWEADSGAPLDKEEVRNFVESAVEEFFKRAEGVDMPMVKATVTVEKTSPKESEKKAPVKKGKGGKGITRKEKIIDEAESKPKGKKKESGTKKKCEGVTAKGTQCSKCALEGEVFCSVHLKKAAAAKADEEPKKKESAPKKGKKKAPAKKKEEHTHEPGEKAEEGCDLCEKHGDVFEVPDYEEVPVEEPEEEPEEEEDDTKKDVTWVLTEEDLEELDTDSDAESVIDEE